MIEQHSLSSPGRPEPDDPPALRPRAAHQATPLVAVQWRFVNRVLPKIGRSARMCVAALRILGPLDIGLLREAVQELVRRHEVLSTRIVSVHNRWLQRVDPAASVHVDAVHLSGAAAKAQQEAVRHASDFLEEEVDLSVGPLFAVMLLRFSETEHALMVAIDHMIADAVTCEIINREIWALYDRRDLPALAVQFADYAVWQEQTYPAWLQRHEAYWTARLHGAPRVRIPDEPNLPASQSAAAAMLHFPLGRKLSAELRGLAQRHETRLPLIMLAVYTVVVSQWCLEQRLVIEFYMHGRHRPELETMLGFFAYPLHLCVSLESNDSFLDLLQRLRLEYTTARQHEDYGRVAYFLPECDCTDLSFNWLPEKGARASVEERRTSRQLRLQPFPARSIWPVKFAAFFSDSAAGIGVTVHYRPDLLSRATIERFGRNIRYVADRLTQDPGAPAHSAAVA